ncbi:hypothetical protein K438DRAFT_1782776 [Mycena galopus ATCC 62051]|nr:hypothetical protein K438DRAFT_1782776 [Mycena galopus ATCC 62051]
MDNLRMADCTLTQRTYFYFAPDNRYTSVALGLAGVILHIINGHRPSNKLGRVGSAIESVAGTLKHAKEYYPWIHAELMGVTSRLLDVKTWKEFIEYLQNSWEFMRDISQCAKNVKDIQVSASHIIEDERQRQLSAGIQESRKILEKVTCSLTHLTSRRRGGYESATRNVSYDSIHVLIEIRVLREP